MVGAMRYGQQVVVGLLGLAAGLMSVPSAAQVAPVEPPDTVHTIVRYSGADRYATAARISEKLSPLNPRVAFVATGESFPDALAAGPAAAVAQGPLLLTRGSSLADATRVELDRLDPQNIVVVGGPTAVSDAVVADLHGLTTGDVVRVAGGDRYETAAAIAANFPAGVSEVHIASGTTFADALAAGPAAASVRGPLLLVHPGHVPPSTAAQLDRLNPGVIVIAGGLDAVSPAVEQALGAFGPVVRVAGADRYETSAAIMARAFRDEGGVLIFFATGVNYPDTLAGGAAAGTMPAPMYLVEPDCVPTVVIDEIERLGTQILVLLGGEGVLSPEVAERKPC